MRDGAFIFIYRVIMIMPVASKRPISPHLQVYRWGPHMLVSILHRACGDALGIAGSLLLLWWLGSLAAGPATYDAFISAVWRATPDGALSVWNWLGRAVLVGLTWAFFQHAASGVRHLLLDTGAGYELKSNRMWSIVVALTGVIATVIFWLLIFGKVL
jgi:succinate dehydrogenase / fumarate reductase, cytochrome b subunit